MRSGITIPNRSDEPKPWIIARREQHPSGAEQVTYLQETFKHREDRWGPFGSAAVFRSTRELNRAWAWLKLDLSTEPWQFVARGYEVVLEERRQQLPREVLDQLKSDFRNGLDEQHAPARLALTGWMETHMDRKTAESEGWQQLQPSSALTVEHVLSRGLDFGGLQ